MNICFFPFYIDSKSHHFKIMNFFKITTFFQNHEFLKTTNFFKITLFTKSRDFKITLFQKSRYFQNHAIFLPFLIIFKTSVFLKKIPVQSSFWNSPFDNM